MPELRRLHAGHAPVVLAFERATRAYFVASVSERGDDCLDRFTDRYNALPAEQEAGSCVLGRVNLVDIDDRIAELGYRIARQVAGHLPVAARWRPGGGKPGTWYQRDLLPQA